jgi:hypothetical protein
MPKVIELLIRKEHSGQVWYEPQSVAPESPRVPQLLPSHISKGVRRSPVQTDSFSNREAEG